MDANTFGEIICDRTIFAFPWLRKLRKILSYIDNALPFINQIIN